jgi:peptidyl-prolyl cis-trans isomerase SurA
MTYRLVSTSVTALLISGAFLVSVYANETPKPTSTMPTPIKTLLKNNPEVKKMTSSKPILLNETIAIVNNGVVTSSELAEGVQQARAQISNEGIAAPNKTTIERQVLQQLILQKLAMQLADRNNIKVSNMEISQTISTIVEQNKTTLSQLKQQLKISGVSYKEYRQNLKTQLTINKLQQQAVAGSIFISPKDIDQYIAKHHDAAQISEYEVQHILLPLPESHTPEATAKAVEKAQILTEDIRAGKLSFTEAAAKYSQSGDALEGGKLGWKTADQLPDIFASKVVTMKEGEISKPFQAGGNLHILYLAKEKQLATQKHYIEQYNASQIVINVTPVVSDDQAKSQLERILIDLKNGASFSDLAKSNSQDYDNANKGGNMGWITLTEVPFKVSKEIEQTAIGKVSQPFKSDDAWQIIKVINQRKKDDTAEYIRQQAANVLFQQKAQQAVKSWMMSLKDNAYIHIINPKLKMSEL